MKLVYMKLCGDHDLDFPKNLYLRFGIGCPTQRAFTLPRTAKNAFFRTFDPWVLLLVVLGDGWNSQDFTM